MSSINNQILRRIRAKQRGWVFTPKDFIDLAKPGTIDQVLYRLRQHNIIRRLSCGIYDFPIQHTKLGNLSPDPDKILKAIMVKTGDLILPSGAKLANQLGLDTQVPAKLVYLTSGKTKTIQILNLTIKLQHTRYIKRNHKQQAASKVVSLLSYLGKDRIDDTVVNKCKLLLGRNDIKQLDDLITILPRWMLPKINQLMSIDYA